MKKISNSSLIPVGFWCEHSGQPFPSIFNAERDKCINFEIGEIENYLTAAPIFIASPGIVRSAFDERKIAGTSSIRTDGIWMWHDTLAYYVREYGIALPLDFIENIRSSHYMPPKDDEIATAELVFN